MPELNKRGTAGGRGREVARRETVSTNTYIGKVFCTATARSGLHVDNQSYRDAFSSSATCIWKPLQRLQAYYFIANVQQKQLRITTSFRLPGSLNGKHINRKLQHVHKTAVGRRKVSCSYLLGISLLQHELQSSQSSVDQVPPPQLHITHGHRVATA